MTSSQKKIQDAGADNVGFISASDQSPEARAKRRKLGIKLAQIEGNPLTDEDLAMFEMFDREGWSDERRRAYVLEQALKEEELAHNR